MTTVDTVRSKGWLALPMMLAAVALITPVSWSAHMLSPHGLRLHEIVAGIWIFKAVLLLNAALLLLLLRAKPATSATPLVRSVAPELAAARGEWLLFAAIMVVALAVRLYGLGQGLWFDEMQTLADYVRLPLLQIVSTFDSQNQHMLYALVAHVTVSLFGESAWALRLPAALMGVASLAALYVLGRELVGRRESFLATAFLAVSYHHVWFSQNARGYTGLLLGTLVATLLLLRMLRAQYRNGWVTAALYGMTMSLTMFVHITAVFVLAAHALIWAVLLFVRRSRFDPANVKVPLLAFLLAGTFTLQLYALVLPQFLETLVTPTMEGMATEWKDPLWMISETLRGLSAGLPGGWLAVILGATIFFVGAATIYRYDVAVCALMVLPVALLASALLALQHNLWPRFFFFAAGFAVLIIVRGVMATAAVIMRRRGVALVTAAFGAVILLSAAQVRTAWYPKQDYDKAEQFIRAHRAAGDAVVTVDMSNYAFNVYRQAHYLAVGSDAELRAIENSHARTWLLYMFPTRLASVQPALWKRLNAEYRFAAEFPGTVGGGTIFIKVKQ